MQIVIASARAELAAAIESRINHPATGLSHQAIINDAVELVALIESHQLDLIVLDIDLPRLSRSLVKQLLTKTKLIAIVESTTANPKKLGLHKQATELNQLSQLLKPFRIQQPNLSPRISIICIATVASGSGASTVGSNMAAAKSRSSEVLLVDLDLIHSSMAVQVDCGITGAGLLSLSQLLQTSDLTPAELAANCVAITTSLRLLPGIGSVTNLPQLNLNLFDEIHAAAIELVDCVVIDLGQLIPSGEISRFQQQIMTNCTELFIVSAADPISMLHTSNWLAKFAANYVSKLQVVINKHQVGGATEITELIEQAAGVKPAAILPHDEIFNDLIWQGQIAVLAKPKTRFSKAVLRWLSPVPQVTQLRPAGLQRLAKAS